MTLARNEPRTHFRRARGYALSFGIVLATGLSASCLSYTTGANSPKAPSSLGTAPPSVAFVFGSPRSDLAAELRHAFASSPHFSNTFDERADADVVLAIDTTRGVKGSSWVIVNIVFLGLLPLPVQNEDRVVLGRMKVGTLDEVALPRVERRTHYWGGLPLLPLFFIQSNESKVRARMAEDVVTHVAAEYSKLHTSTWNAANVDGAIDTLEAFVVSFPTSTHGADARRTLDNQLYAAVQRNGRAQDYLRYLRRFPDSARAPEVRAQGAEPTWTVLSAIPDQERLEEYLEAFEGSPYIGEANKALETLLFNRAKNARSDANLYRICLERFPGGTYAAVCRDALAWAHAESAGTPLELRAYLREFPTGTFSANAVGALERYADEDLMRAAAEVEASIDRVMRSQWPRSGMRGNGDLSGTLLSKQPGLSLSLGYDATITNGYLGRYTIKSGSAAFEGETFFMASDRAWYPAFPIVFDQVADESDE